MQCYRQNTWKHSCPSTPLAEFQTGMWKGFQSNLLWCNSTTLMRWGWGNRNTFKTHTAGFSFKRYILIKLSRLLEQQIINQSCNCPCRTVFFFKPMEKRDCSFAFKWQKLITMVTTDWVIRLYTWCVGLYSLCHIMDSYYQRVATIYHRTSCSCTDNWKFHPNGEIPNLESWKRKIFSQEYTD